MRTGRHKENDEDSVDIKLPPLELESVPSTSKSDKSVLTTAPFSPLWRELAIVFLCTCGQISLTLPATALLGGLQEVANDFGMAQAETSWVSSAVLTSSGSFLLLAGRLADIYGRKKVLVSSYLILAVWSFVAGFAQNKYFPLLRYLFFVARGLQGLCGAGAVPAALGILGANYPPGKRKNMVFAAFSAGNPLGAATGLVLGGILTSYISWRWVMFVIGIFAVAISLAAFLIIPLDQSHDTDRRVDWLGAVTVTAGFSLLCFGITEAGVAPNGWATWWIILCLIVGPALVGVFVFIESRVPCPLMPLRIWKIPHFGRVLLCYGVGFGGFWGGVLYGYSLFYGQIYQANPVQVTLYLIPMTVVGLLTNIGSAFILHIVPGNILMALGLLSIAIATFLGALQPLNLTYWAMSFPAMVIGVIGADVTTLVSTIFATTNVSLSEQSIVSALVGTSGALFGAVFSALVAALISGVGGNAIGELTPDRSQLIKGFHAEFWFVFGCSIVTAFLALTLKVGRQDENEAVEASIKQSSEHIERTYGNTGQDKERHEMTISPPIWS